MFFSSLIPSFSFFASSKGDHDTTTRQILDVFFALIFIPIVIYASLFTLDCCSYLRLLIYACVLFVSWSWGRGARVLVAMII